MLLQQGGALPGGYGLALLETLLALAAVCVLAWAVLRWSRGRGLLGAGGRVRVLERTPLDARRALYLVAIGDRVLLIGAGESGPPALLAELDPDALPPEPERVKSFADLVARVRGEKPPAPE